MMTSQSRTVLKMRESTAGVRLAGLAGASLDLLGGQSVAALAAAVLVDGGLQVGLAEVRPQRRGENHFRVGELEHEKIADALFTRRPDQEIGFGQLGGVEIATEAFP